MKRNLCFWFLDFIASEIRLSFKEAFYSLLLARWLNSDFNYLLDWDYLLFDGVLFSLQLHHHIAAIMTITYPNNLYCFFLNFKSPFPLPIGFSLAFHNYPHKYILFASITTRASIFVRYNRILYLLEP